MKNKSSNHEKAPICSAWVKQMREVFGEDQVKVIWVKEGDLEIGKKDDAPNLAPPSQGCYSPHNQERTAARVEEEKA